MNINKIPLDPLLPAVELTEQWARRLNQRLYELLPKLTHNLNLSTGGYHTLTTVTTNYTASEGDEIILVDASGGARTVILPDAATVGGKIFRVKKIESSGNSVTVDPAVGNVDGAASVSWTTALAAFAFVSDGQHYWSI